MTGPSTLIEGPDRPMGIKIRDITSPLLPMTPQEIMEEQETKTEEKSAPTPVKNSKEIAKTLKDNEMKNEDKSLKENEIGETQDKDSQNELAPTIVPQITADNDDKKID